MNLDQLRDLLARAEFHRFLKVEAVSVDAAAGTVALRLPYSEAYSLFPAIGNYHGGVLAALIDVAGTMACTVVKGRPTPTLNLRIDYLKGASMVDLHAEGRAHRVGKTFGVADVVISSVDGAVYALGRGTFSTA